MGKSSRRPLTYTEVEIATFLSSQALAADPLNHCVPIYEYPTTKIRLFSPCHSYDRCTISLAKVGEVFDFFGQLFEVRCCNKDSFVNLSQFTVPLGLAIYAQTPCRAPVCTTPPR